MGKKRKVKRKKEINKVKIKTSANNRTNSEKNITDSEENLTYLENNITDSKNLYYQINSEKGKDSQEENDEILPSKKSPLTYLLIFFVIFLLIAWIIPSYSLKKYQNPKNIPPLSSFKFSSMNYTRYNFTDIKDIYVVINNPNIKDIADKIAIQSCDNRNRLCYAKSMYYFVRDNIKHINDPVNEEYIENPLQVLASGGADCESGSALLVSMLLSIGIQADFVFIPRHAFVKAILPEAPRTYKKDGNIVYMDWTCKSCKFGDLPPTDLKYINK